MKIYSWGRTEKISPSVHSQFDPKIKNNLVCGNRMSYGDVCLNSSNLTENINNNAIISFDEESGVLHVESGITIREILQFSMSKLYFLYVTPGTKNVTIGGAIANNVHGKEHHLYGSFGNFITEFKLVNSTGTYLCSRDSNSDLFHNSIGGIGLTGYIKTVKLKLKKVTGNQICRRTIKFNKASELKKLFQKYSESTYTVAWFDSFSYKDDRLNGLFYIGEFTKKTKPFFIKTNSLLQFLPSFLLNKYTIRIFNILNYIKRVKKDSVDIVNYEDFFYPLDKVENWNKIYGKNGFYQFQCVLPFEKYDHCFPMLMKEANRMGSFLSVIKIMKDEELETSKLSFPCEGISIALDFKNSGHAKKIISKMNKVVTENDGKVYLAKDSVLTKLEASHMYNLKSFSENKDENLNSLLWERITCE